MVITGGKLDAKKEVLALMEACRELPRVRLLIFGCVLPDIEERFEALLAQSENVTFIGWLDADRVYDYYFAADLVAFPGQHSVLWEQACAAKVPCLFARWDGMEHVNNGGNSVLVDKIDSDSLREEIRALCFTDAYRKMQEIAASPATDIYFYSHIAEKSLECAPKSK